MSPPDRPKGELRSARHEGPPVSVLLQAHDLRRHYDGPRRGLRAGDPVKALDGVSFEVHHGETLALVGESGCGKSTLARIVAGLDAPTSGTLTLQGAALAGPGRNRRETARQVQIVFQDPFSSLNPRMRVEDIVAEPLEGQGMPRAQRMERISALLRAVGLPAESRARLPHQFSGGQRQRIAIARALSIEPRLLVLDEPVSALDVSVRAQILNLLSDLKRERGIASLLISHDMSAVRHLADRVAVMYLGRLAEVGPAGEVFAQPRHPYTRTLLAAIPGLASAGHAARDPTATTPASTAALSREGCLFAPRCAHAGDICRGSVPVLEAQGQTDHPVACHHALALPAAVAASEAPLGPLVQRRLSVLRQAREQADAASA